MERITWVRCPGHRDGQVISAYEGNAESGQTARYLIESRMNLHGRKAYHLYVFIGNYPRPVPASSEVRPESPSLKLAKQSAETHLNSVARQAGA